jgi:ABC-type transporter Mla maintaining outer membrane lipid asymmetry ATPase subunit MlaF
MYSALNYADNLAFLHKGEIVFYGSTKEFMKCEHPMVQGFLTAEKHHVEGPKK